ncbi:4-carboxymuconolactone decarboxylase [Methanosarcina barkeri 3]|uniref:4-carboxymuconolactone decarboxylase n=1 Tax=Methanosarcina barkeri 3 TaxID=1434107 RepID=A0A0E3WYE7_METBA|nr:carboxymuconolactone decarboxylase family protein [Methanosarcina barkeri]AKB83404.1 4-carboxymuconolactone decarboxylase [Methanosarcina barkeri 3]
MENERYERGWLKLKEIDGKVGEEIVKSLESISPDLGKYIIEFSFGDIYSRESTSLKQKEIAVVAALTAMGNAAPQLNVHINGALNVGCSVEEILEVIIQMSSYSGFPGSLNAINVLKEVIKDRKITFEPVKEDKNGDRFSIGLEMLSQLEKNQMQILKENLDDIAPDMVEYIIAYGYGDVYSRKNLSLKMRQIATIAALTAMGTARPQLAFHIKAGLNIGLTKEEIIETIILMCVYAGFPAALNGINTAKEVFANL